MTKKFPKKLFVAIRDIGTSDQYFAAEEDCIDLADETDGVIPVGVYELVTTGKLATRSTFEADAAKPKKR